MTSNGAQVAESSTVLFVCLHGSAKSLIAAEHFTRLAESRGLPWRGESSGVESDVEVPAAVVSGLANDGITVRAYRPRQLAADHATAASHVVSFGCDLSPVLSARVPIERWDDLPLVSDGYAAARAAIVTRVARLLDTLQRPTL